MGGINVGARRRASGGEHAVQEPVAQQTSRGGTSSGRGPPAAEKTSTAKNTDSELVVCHSRGGKCVRGFRHLFKRGSVRLCACVWPSSTRCRSGSSCTYTVCIVLTYSLQSAVSCYPDHLSSEVRSFPPSPGQRAEASVASARPPRWRHCCGCGGCGGGRGTCGRRPPLRAACKSRLVATSRSFRHRRRRWRLLGTYAGPARWGGVNPDGRGSLGSLFVSLC